MSQSTPDHATSSPAEGRIATPPDWRRVRGDGWLLHADDHVEEPLGFAEAVAAGLEEHPRTLPYRYLYDAAGSEIYERITEQPEYYPTRTEEAILAAHADAMRARAGNDTLVEFGSGSSRKTRHLLEAWRRAGACRYVPIDISLSALQGACEALAGRFDGLAVEGVASTYERAMPLLPAVSPATFVFLGSTIGNFDNAELDVFLERIASHLTPGDAFLLGIDLVKDPAMLERAYNDEAGWTARFTENLFARLNRELGAGVPLSAVEHVAYYNDRLARIEIYARFRHEVELALPAIDRSFRIAAGEMIRTEISRKFRADEVAANAARFGLLREELYTDPDEIFGVLLLRRARSVPVAESRNAELENLLRFVRERTHAIVAPLSDQELAATPGPPMGPVVWDLAHIADFERLWLIDSIGGDSGALDPTYDPAIHGRDQRGELALPGRLEARQKLRDVRAEALARLRSGAVDPTDPLTEDGFIYRMVAQHESQHQETMLQAIQMAGGAYEPSFRDSGPRRPDWQPVGESVLVPGGRCWIGTDDRTVSYDNERPRHEVALGPFRIDAAPVTNGAYLEFMRADGYARSELWSQAGWRWREEARVEAPMYWHRVDGDWWRRSFGRDQPIDPVRPVVHVSWFEADAYARWAGKRLPTEQEWEKAAAWDPARVEARRYPWGDDPPTSERANLAHRLLEPQPVGAYPIGRSFFGLHQMLGDVYEWTSSDFVAYPGFEAFPYAEYSEAFFGSRYKVLRGASWAVPEVMARNTYRNWDLPERRQIFAGFRCAADG